MFVEATRIVTTIAVALPGASSEPHLPSVIATTSYVYWYHDAWQTDMTFPAQCDHMYLFAVNCGIQGLLCV